MFSSALKSFTSNISSNYTVSPNPATVSGAWKIFDAKKKSTGKPASVFVFEKKSLDSQGGGFGVRSNAASLKRAQDEVVERLKKEASSLARLRHPSILELVEPVEETRNGGLMFATEPVTASLAGLLLDKDNQEKAGGVGGRRSRYVVEEADGKGRRRRELEIDELEIQKGLLQIGKGLEFLHESAGLVHGNLNPEAIFVNAKSDWKVSGLAFSGPAENSNIATSVAPIALSEVLDYDARLPRSVQLNLDFASPDFVLDTNVTTSADMFSLGLLIIALYNSPHKSPLETNGSVSTYKKLFASNTAIPSQNNKFLSSQPLPKEIASGVLPRLITRRPAQRFTAREFQQAQYFDNILVSTIRFLESLPAKTPNEKLQFMRGLPRILGQFPRTVLEKKVLPGLLDEMKDRELLSVVLQNVFKIIQLMPSGKRPFSEKVIPSLREIFIGNGSGKASTQERDSWKEAGIMVLLDNMQIIKDNSSGKEFKDDILPIVYIGLESSTHALVDASLKAVGVIVPALDYSTIKNELFPVVATVFSKTNSMGIKIRGLDSLKVLCGGISGSGMASGDAIESFPDAERSKQSQSASAALDKYTVQEKVVPLLKGIKTKEPAVMMGALEVFKQVGKIADADFLALEVLPVLWAFSLGPLLNVEQFQAHMSLIKTLSTQIEREQTRKLQELSASNTAVNVRADDLLSQGGISDLNGGGGPGFGDDIDFEGLVLGRREKAQSSETLNHGWDSSISPPLRTLESQSGYSQKASNMPTFSWSTQPSSESLPKPRQGTTSGTTGSRTITPDQTLSSFAALQPSNVMSQSFLSQPLQPSSSGPPGFAQNTSTSSLWSTPIPGSTKQSSNAFSQKSPLTSGSHSTSSHPSLSLPPPNASSTYSAFSIARPPPPPTQNTSLQSTQSHRAGAGHVGQANVSNVAGSKQGLDKYESLL